MIRLCTRCAKTFTDEPWRAGCTRCGANVVADSELAHVHAAIRAHNDGWYPGGKRMYKNGKLKHPERA